ncbi:MAG: hypothetical protein A2854_00795 [Parcubacteria group bacterium RIFCSPHIGHO2_01_FULL_56_18]|nr:MAG: hypothetical protein A2854_00795 [Parcubacteria group bacterium RIFCSPHIGHO2_01_FULL_56_18]
MPHPSYIPSAKQTHSGGRNIIITVGRHDKAVFEHALTSFHIHYCLSICTQRDILPEIRTEISEMRHLHHFDDVDWNEFLPLDEELIERMRDCETVALQMMGRTGVMGKTIPYQERKRTYLQILRFCNSILTEKNIDLFLLSSIPHHGLTYVFYVLCRKRGIPVLFVSQWDPLPDTFSLQENWEDPAPELARRFHELKTEVRNPATVPLSPQFEEYWQVHTEHVDDVKTGMQQRSDEQSKRSIHCRPEPWYVLYTGKTPFGRWRERAYMILRANPLQFLWHVLIFIPRRLRPSRLRGRLLRMRAYSRGRAIFRFYDSNVRNPDLSHRYIYVPLHLQPEATTLPMGGAYVDQILLVHMLNALLPADILLYVKEHPYQKKGYPDGCDRSVTFYKDLLACKRVRFVSTKESSYRLTQHALAVAVITGTAGLEALFRAKPVLMFGHRYFQYAPGVFPVHTVEDCKRALHAIIDEGAKPSLPDVRLFLKAVEDVISECAMGEYGKVSKFSREENARRAGMVIAAEIEKRLGWQRRNVSPVSS